MNNKMTQDIDNYIYNFLSSVELTLIAQLKKLDVHISKYKLKTHCRRISHVGPSDAFLADYFFEDILLLSIKKDNNNNYVILAPEKYNRRVIRRAKKYLND